MIGGIDGISFFSRSEKQYRTTVRNDSEKKELEELNKKNSDVRTYLLAHLAAAGPYVKRISIQYRQGPDGGLYMVSGEVQIDTAEVPGDSEATIAKAEAISRAACAVQDYKTVDAASGLEARAIKAKSHGGSDGQNILGSPVSAYSQKESEPGGILNEVV